MSKRLHATRLAPGDVPKTAPGDVPKTAPGDVPKTAPGDVPKTAPGAVERPARGCCVKFVPETKTHDGLLPVHRVLDGVVWSFFAGKIRTVKDVYDHVEQDQLRHLVEVYGLVGDLLERAKRAPGGKAVNLLPRGGGRGSMVKYSAHKDALTYLRELLRRAHNRLHEAAGVVARMSKVNATAFVMHCARHPEVLARFSKLGPAALPLQQQQQEQEQEQ